MSGYGSVRVCRWCGKYIKQVPDETDPGVDLWLSDDGRFFCSGPDALHSPKEKA